MKELLLIAINYCCEKETLLFCEQIANQTIKDNITVIIVNNKSSETAEIDLDVALKKINIDIKYYDFNKNLGYLNGCLAGIDEFTKEEGYFPKWIAISNTDIIISDVQFFEKFLHTEYEKDIWCVGPSIIELENIYCNPHYLKRISKKKIIRLIKIFNSKFLSIIYYFLAEKKAKKRTIKNESTYVYSNHGSFFFVKSELYKCLNGEKYGALLYSEESFIAEFILENNKRAYYDNSLELFHSKNLVTGKLGKQKCAKHISQSLKYIRKRFYDKK